MGTQTFKDMTRAGIDEVLPDQMLNKEDQMEMASEKFKSKIATMAIYIQ